MKYISITVDQLDFDVENPRYDPQKNQIVAFETVINGQRNKLVALMRHIAENGLNPMKRPAVIQNSQGRYAVVEGNRRLAALRILFKPEVLQGLNISQGSAKALKVIAKGFDGRGFEKMEVVLFDSRDEALPWVELEHTGQNEGAGTVPWDGIQTSRFRKRDPALVVLDYSVAQGIAEDGILSERQPFPVTTLRRLVNDPYVRNGMGIDVKLGEVTSTVPHKELAKALRKILKDIGSGDKTVSDLKRKEQRAQYIDELGPRFLPSRKHSLSPWRLDPSGSRPVVAPKATGTAKNRKSQEKRRFLIPQECTLSIRESRLQKIYYELRRALIVKETPNAVAVLFRVFVELSADLYIAKERLPVKNAKGRRLDLKEKITNVADDLVSKSRATRSDMHMIKVAAQNPIDQHSTITFHAFVHNRHAAPIPSELLSMWTRIEPFISAIYNAHP